MDLPELLKSILPLFGGASVVIVGISAWLGKVWAGRIQAMEAAKHSRDLEQLKADLIAKHSEDLERTKAELQIHIEQAKWPMQREDALAANFRDALQSFLLPTMSAIHSVCWLTWLAENASDEFTAERLRLYEEELHGYLPQITSSLTLLSAHDAPTYRKLKKCARMIYELDGDTARAARKHLLAQSSGTSDDAAKAELSSCFKRAGALEVKIPDYVAGIVQDANSRRGERVARDFCR